MIETQISYTIGSSNGTTVAGQSGVSGAFANQLNLPTSVTFDQFGYMYIMDAGNNRIQQWASGSAFGVTVASASLSNPRGLSIDPNGNLAVADYSYDRVVLFPVVCRKYKSFFH